MKTKLPEGWRIMKLTDISENISAGGTPAREKKEYWLKGTIPWLKISDMKHVYIKETEEKITKDGLDNSSAKLFPKGTLVYSIFATLGAIGILEIDTTTNQAIAGITPKKEIISTKYLYYCLQAERDKILAKKSHATQDNLNLTILRNHEIAVPPLQTQKKIVSILEKSEQAKEWRRESDELTKELLKAVFLEMFGDPVRNTNKWKTKSIEDLTSFVSYGFTRPMPHIEEGLPIITSKNVITSFIDFLSVDYTDRKSFNELSNKDKPIKGDILYTKDGRIGEAAIVEDSKEFCISQAVAVLRPKNKEIDPIFFERLLNSDKFKKLIERQAYGVALKHISITKLKREKIIFPPLLLQQKFASIVKKVEIMKEQQNQSKEHLDNLFNVLMQKAFKGELV